MSSRLRGFILAIISAIGFGWLAIFARFAYAAGADAPTVLFLRFLIAGAVMLGIMAFRREAFPRGKPLLALIAMGGVGYVLMSFLYFTGLTLASTSLIALLLYLYPALVTLISAIVFRERITRLKAFALAVTFIGTILTVGLDISGQPLGIVIGIGASLVYAIYIIVGGQVMRKVSPIPATTVITLAAMVVFGVMAFSRGPQWPQTPLGWGAVMGIALISTVLAMGTFLASIERIGSGNASLVSSFEPAVTVSLAAVLFNEQITLLRIAGGALIIFSVILLAHAELRDKNLPPPE